MEDILHQLRLVNIPLFTGFQDHPKCLFAGFLNSPMEQKGIVFWGVQVPSPPYEAGNGFGEVVRVTSSGVEDYHYRGTPRWMVYFMENPIKMDDLGGKPTIFGNTHI